MVYFVLSCYNKERKNILMITVMIDETAKSIMEVYDYEWMDEEI